MRGISLLATAAALGLITGCSSIPVLKKEASFPRNEAEFNSKWQLVWSDEFDKDGAVDVKKWKAQLGGGGWGNEELQHYTGSRENARVENGFLIIEAHKRRMGDNNYTSARLNSTGQFAYGRFEVRAKMPSGRGTWPAIWMMPAGDGRYSGGAWPDNGEIDIMEHVGFDQGIVHGSLHTKSYNWIIGTQKTGQIRVDDLSDEFHVYAVEWTPERIDLFVDNQRYYGFSNPHLTHKEWPFDQPFYFILNIAVGGHWGGKQGVDETIFPQRMTVDYVRAYRSVGPVNAPLASQ